MIKDLAFKSPESAGLSTKAVIKFVKKIKDRKINLYFCKQIKA